MIDTAPNLAGLSPARPSIPDRRIDIRAHGAVEGGGQLCTEAVGAAIAACAAAGGGWVIIPSGDWLTGPIHLASRVGLHLEAGAELRFSQDPDHYLPVVLIQRGGVWCYNYSPLIYARECHDIAITGSGTIDGQGESWWPWKKAQPGMVELFQANIQRVPVEQRVYGTREAGVRPPFIQTIGCERLLIEGVMIRNSPSWTVHPVECQDVTIRHIRLINPESAPNTDGIDADACRRVLIEHCMIESGDDPICLKSGRDADGRERNVACEDVLIRHCQVKAGHGGIVIGSETSGGVRNVLVQDCTCDGTERGVRIKTRAGRGGAIENITIERLTVGSVRDEAVGISMRYNGERAEPPAGDSHLPQVRNITIRGLICTSAGRSFILEGLAPQPMRDVTLEDIVVPRLNDMRIVDVAGLTMRNVRQPERS